METSQTETWKMAHETPPNYRVQSVTIKFQKKFQNYLYSHLSILPEINTYILNKRVQNKNVFTLAKRASLTIKNNFVLIMGF